MILDTSALIAIVLGEAEAEKYLGYLSNATGIRISAATLLETQIVARRRGAQEDLERLLQALELEIVPFAGSTAGMACDGYENIRALSIWAIASATERQRNSTSLCFLKETISAGPMYARRLG